MCGSRVGFAVPGLCLHVPTQVRCDPRMRSADAIRANTIRSNAIRRCDPRGCERAPHSGTQVWTLAEALGSLLQPPPGGAASALSARLSGAVSSMVSPRIASMLLGGRDAPGGGAGSVGAPPSGRERASTTVAPARSPPFFRPLLSGRFPPAIPFRKFLSGHWSLLHFDQSLAPCLLASGLIASYWNFAGFCWFGFLLV